MNEVAEYLKYNTLEIRDDVIEMVSGEEIDIIIDEEFRVGQGAPRTKEEIYKLLDRLVLVYLYFCLKSYYENLNLKVRINMMYKWNGLQYGMENITVNEQVLLKSVDIGDSNRRNRYFKLYYNLNKL